MTGYGDVVYDAHIMFHGGIQMTATTADVLRVRVQEARHSPEALHDLWREAGRMTPAERGPGLLAQIEAYLDAHVQAATEADA